MILRGNMSKSLVESKILIGMNQNEVINLLGNPDGELINNYVYDIDIGMKWGSDVWFYMLMIYFNSESKLVEEVEIND